MQVEVGHEQRDATIRTSRTTRSGKWIQGRRLAGSESADDELREEQRRGRAKHTQSTRGVGGGCRPVYTLYLSSPLLFPFFISSSFFLRLQ